MLWSGDVDKAFARTDSPCGVITHTSVKVPYEEETELG